MNRPRLPSDVLAVVSAGTLAVVTIGWAVTHLRDSVRLSDRYVRPGFTTEQGGAFDGGSSPASNDI